MIVGYIAGALTTACWLPQLIRSIRTGKVDSFSWIYLFAISTGVALWFCYGVIRDDLAIELPNGLSFVAIAALIVVKARVALSGEEMLLDRATVVTAEQPEA